jgi:hypothetical protein
VPISKTLDNASSTTVRWQTYVKGGVTADDTRALQKMKEEGTKYLETIRKTPQSDIASSIKPTKLVQVSPEKKSAISTNANLLIDVDIGARTSTYVGAVPSKSKGKTKVSMNLLD